MLALNRYGETPLMIAAQRGQSGIVFDLLQAGADGNVQDSQRRTALMLAARQGSTKIATLLVNAGADISIKALDDRTAVDCAFSTDHVSLAAKLIESQAKREIKSCFLNCEREGDSFLNNVRGISTDIE